MYVNKIEFKSLVQLHILKKSSQIHNPLKRVLSLHDNYSNI